MLKETRIEDVGKRRVVIVGGGFAGIELAKALHNVDVQVILLDKDNFHTFQPLLYQVATAGLEAPSIAQPFREIFEEQKNFYFRMAEVLSVDTDKSVIETSIGSIQYDFLVIATGAITNFYSNKEIQKHAIPLKRLDHAVLLRNTVLNNFEKALQIEDEEDLNSLMDFVIVGGGPTGVEVAGALSELRKHVFPNDYKELDFMKMDIHLIEGSPRLLNGMSDEAGQKALKFLEDFGVKVLLNRQVQSYDGYTVKMDNGESLITRTLIWAAGVTGSPINGIRQESILRGNRLKVDHYNRVDGYDNIFAIGDIAAMITPENPRGHAMMAQPAMQQGRLLGKNIDNVLKGKPLEPFAYKDKGSMATIGRNHAVADIRMFSKEYKTQGVFAWFVWMFIHLLSIIGFRNKLVVLLNWTWSYFSFDKGVRLILGSKKENLVQEELEHKT